MDTETQVKRPRGRPRKTIEEKKLTTKNRNARYYEKLKKARDLYRKLESEIK
jgi:hypothetical protein